jgi:glycosyltransferase involved in cell wall biosynthesis
VRVLILAPRAPDPPDHGAALRNLRILSWLGARHEVALVTFGDPDDARARDVLGRHARDVAIIRPPRRSLGARLRDLLAGRPDLVRRLWCPEFVAAVRARLKPPGIDLVHIEGLELYGMWEAARVDGIGSPRVVLDDHNAEFSLQRSAARASLRRGAILGGAYSLIQSARLRRYEARAARRSDAVLAVSPDDAAALRGIGARAALGDPIVVPNGVDLDRYRPLPRPRDGRTALFIGKLDYRPNQDAVEWLGREIWPRVRAGDPRARLRIVGRDRPPRLAALHGKDGVEVVGAVSDDRSAFDEADLLLVPMRMGGGVRLKVVQAFAMGLPVVATPAGVAGMPVEHGRHCLVATTAAGFADQVLRAFADPTLRQRVAENGLTLARTEYDWRVILPTLDRVYAELATPIARHPA